MRLSEAMRLGATLSPQTWGRLIGGYRPSEAGTEYSTCALGAAADAAGMLELPKIASLHRVWPILNALVAEHELPVGISRRPFSRRLSQVIFYLNDVERWSRSRIADWIEDYERRHPECVATEESRPEPAAANNDWESNEEGPLVACK